MFTSAAMMTALDAVSARFRVDCWRAGGLRAWPLFRYELATTNHYLLNRPPPSLAGVKPPNRWVESARRSLKTVADSQRDRAQNDTFLHQRDAVFYSDGVSFARLGASYFEKFCEPVMEHLERDFGHSSLLLTPLHFSRVPRHKMSVLVQNQLDLALTASAISSRLAKIDVDLEGYDEALRLIEEMLPGALLPTRQRLFRNAHISMRLSLVCEIWLRLVRPRVVFIVAYYGNERAAMVLACQRLGIASVDLQHGAVSDVHFAYTRMGRVPESGYELLPDWFWVWTDDDKKRIESWASGSSRHRVVTGGNPFVTYCSQGRAPQLRPLAQAIDDVVNQRSGMKHVLFSANGYETTEQLHTLARVIRETKQTHCWWLRMHPARLSAIQHFRSALADCTEALELIDLASQLPLPLLLARMNFHVTEGSSTADEAALFGVPSVLFADEGTSQFAPLLERGAAIAVDGLSAVGHGLATAARLSLLRPPPSDAQEHHALETILADR